MVCATRFNLFQGGCLLQTERPYCGQADSFLRLVSCVKIGPPSNEPGALVDYLAELADPAYNVNPGIPRPIREGRGVELELTPC